MRKIKLNYLIYFLLTVLIIYQDSPLGLFMGAFGYSLMPTINIILCVVYIMLRGGKIKIEPYVRGLLYLFAYLCVVSVVAVIVWIALGKPSTLLGEDIIIKSIKVLMYFFSYISFLILMNMLTKGFTEEQFLKPIYFVLLLITLICIVEYFTMPNAFSFLHFTGNKTYNRIRLLSKESSWTTMTVYVYSLLSIYYGVAVKKKKSILVISLICITILLALTSSKTLIIAVFISIAVLLLLNSRNMTRSAVLRSFGILVIAILTYMVLSTKLSSAIESSLQWSSIPTRIYTTLIGLVIGLKFPFGTGTALYLSLFPSFLSKYYYLLSDYDTGYALREINSYIHATSDETVAAKSGLLQYNMYWGIIGSIVFIYFLYKFVYRKLALIKSEYILLLKLGIIVTTILLISSVDFTFEYWLLISFLLYKVRENCISTKIS